jgi:hypothetical protein
MVGRETPSFLEIDDGPEPSAAAMMMRARSTVRASAVREWVRDSTA